MTSTELAPAPRPRKRPPSPNFTTTLHPDEYPEIYALQCVGNCLEPEIADGTQLVFLRDAVYRPGDFVVLHRRPENVKLGECQLMVKRLIIAPSHAFWRHGDRNMGDIRPVVIVEMLSPRKVLYMSPDDLLGIHKCRGPAEPGEVGKRRLSEDEVRRRYKRAAPCA